VATSDEQEQHMGLPVSAILDGKGHDVATVGTEATLGEVVRQLTERGVGALVVVDAEEAVAGMISERDVVRVLATDGGAALDHPVSSVMTRPVTTCAPSTTSEELAGIMTEGRIRHLPVLDEGRLVGLVSIGDVVKSRIDELSTQAESLERYVTGSAY
jgi:CBS domain-containing protein